MAKELMWHGKSEQEVLRLDMKQFMQLVPSRARRSLQRGLTPFQKTVMVRLESGDKEIRTHARDMIIVPIMLGKTFKIYNGKEFHPVLITLEMLGHTLGEFSHTRRVVSHSAAGVGATRSSKAVSAR